ncbi:hypothetical protein KP509_12G037800 [Ceratopteris richardii]|uniref:SP-RING-type domain-containing protein n=1 Tax=Ceratopteris richardii TaxID=49495 RepID=A0A8T2TMN5_CERRI|nr:hypothetical protein KP509_12G037800 [Ceratopteris richardii]KAH7423063.1 hypothetical protein KP509_12G037800 [Ceratopteris richardii]
MSLDRLRSAISTLEESNHSLHMELGSSAIMIKMLAEDLEKEGQKELVESLGVATKEIIELIEEFDFHNKALSSLKDEYTVRDEVTDFEVLLSEKTERLRAESHVPPEHHALYKQFQEAVWNVHHAGEPMPGQEKEDLIMYSSQFNVVNTKCPITGKEVIDLENPVRSSDCMHIYDRDAVMNYVKQYKGKGRPCPCAAAGCPKPLVLERLVCDPMLKVEIQELRMRGRVNSQVHDVAECTELDD